jgi:hypothetical protein
MQTVYTVATAFAVEIEGRNCHHRMEELWVVPLGLKKKKKKGQEGKKVI